MFERIFAFVGSRASCESIADDVLDQRVACQIESIGSSTAVFIVDDLQKIEINSKTFDGK